MLIVEEGLLNANWYAVIKYKELSFKLLSSF